jgi:hypothetical protein
VLAALLASEGGPELAAELAEELAAELAAEAAVEVVAEVAPERLLLGVKASAAAVTGGTGSLLESRLWV